jgi:hypothetical protein
MNGSLSRWGRAALQPMSSLASTTRAPGANCPWLGGYALPKTTVNSDRTEGLLREAIAATAFGWNNPRRRGRRKR